MRRLITLLTLLLALLPALAQEYWRPSDELVARAREEPVLTNYIKRFFEDSKQHNGRLFKLEERTELRGEELHILHKIKWDERNYYTEGQTVYVERETSTPATWASQRKEQFSALELALNAKNEEPLVWYNQLYNPWMTWLFYITGFTLVDEWEFNKPKKMNGTVVTTSKDLADAAIKIHALPDWSRESQFAIAENPGAIAYGAACALHRGCPLTIGLKPDRFEDTGLFLSLKLTHEELLQICSKY